MNLGLLFSAQCQQEDSLSNRLSINQQGDTVMYLKKIEAINYINIDIKLQKTQQKLALALRREQSTYNSLLEATQLIVDLRNKDNLRQEENKLLKQTLHMTDEELDRVIKQNRINRFVQFGKGFAVGVGVGGVVVGGYFIFFDR